MRSTDRLTEVVELRSRNAFKDKDLVGTVSGTQIKSDLLIFGKQLSLIHKKMLCGTKWEKSLVRYVSNRDTTLVKPYSCGTVCLFEY